MKRSIFLVFLCLALCLSLVGCVTAGPSIPDDTNSPTTSPTLIHPNPTVKPFDPPPTTEPSVPTPTVPVVPQLLPSFSQMPQVNSDYAEVYISDHIAIFAFIMPGMNDAVTTLVTYDLYADTLLGQLELGEGNIKIFALTEDHFAVLDLNRASYRIYDSACRQMDERVLVGLSAPLGFAGLLGDVLILSQSRDGQVLLYDLNSDTAMVTELEPNPYRYVGSFGESFLVSSFSMDYLRVDLDGSVELLYDQGNAHAVCNGYIAGVQGDYITLLPVQDGDAVMVPSGVYGEMFVDAEGTGLLSRSQHFDKPDVVQYYDITSMTVRQACVGGMVVNAALQQDHAVIITRSEYGAVLQFEFVDFSRYDAQPIHSLAYDGGFLNGRDPLPEPTGSDKMLSLIQRYQTEYGVRILYEPDIFDLEYVGYTMYPCTEEAAYEKAVVLEKLLQFLPEGLLREVGNRWPMVIYLCEDIHPTAGGMHTVMGGYNVLFLSVTGHDDYFLNVAAHEMGHALDIGMSQEVLSGWQALMPEDVRQAYQNLSLTVEFTPDDKGRTPVWFVDVYSRFSEREDRAVLFSFLFDAWLMQDDSILQYEGLRIKADYWAEMLRLTYESCKDVVFPWENRK